MQRARALGDDLLLGESLAAYASTVRLEEAGPLFAEALACTERSGDLGMKLNIHNNAGWAALEIMGSASWCFGVWLCRLRSRVRVDVAAAGW